MSFPCGPDPSIDLRWTDLAMRTTLYIKNPSPSINSEREGAADEEKEVEDRDLPS